MAKKNELIAYTEAFEKWKKETRAKLKAECNAEYKKSGMSEIYDELEKFDEQEDILEDAFSAGYDLRKEQDIL